MIKNKKKRKYKDTLCRAVCCYLDSLFPLVSRDNLSELEFNLYKYDIESCAKWLDDNKFNTNEIWEDYKELGDFNEIKIYKDIKE